MGAILSVFYCLLCSHIQIYETLKWHKTFVFPLKVLK